MKKCGCTGTLSSSAARGAGVSISERTSEQTDACGGGRTTRLEETGEAMSVSHGTDLALLWPYGEVGDGEPLKGLPVEGSAEVG